MNSGFSKVCPICAKPRAESYRPFCSKRCADIDLHRWLAGSYAIPAAESEQIGDGEEWSGRGGDEVISAGR